MALLFGRAVVAEQCSHFAVSRSNYPTTAGSRPPLLFVRSSVAGRFSIFAVQRRSGEPP